MEVNELFTKLKELGYINTKRAELRELCKLNIDQILKYLPRRILNSDGRKIVDCLLNGLSDNTTAYRSKIKVIDIVTKTLRKESTSLTHCGDLVSRIGLELGKVPVIELIQWCNETVQSIVDDSDVNMIWKDVLPECLNTITPMDTVKHCGTEMSGAEYKEQCVRTLCQCGWKERQLVQLTAMFNDMQLARNEHKQVVNKICSYIMECPPDTLPALVHQLVKLCKSHDFDIVLSHLGHYFSAQLYSKLEPSASDSEATTMDIDDIVPYSPAEVSSCLSTCIYHVVEGMDKHQLSKWLRNWPRSQLLRAPFLLDLALALSAERDCRALCLDVIKAGIVSREAECTARRSCAGARAALPRAAPAAAVLRVLTTESASHRQLTVLGLINLAFALLAVPRGRPHAAACWSHGKLVLARLSKAQPECAPHVLARLADRLHSGGQPTLPQYADCLYVLCKLTPLSIERCSQLTGILENCKPSADYKSAALVFQAVHPLINFSIRTRDSLFMVCRKGINSRDSAHRCLALSGFLTVLRHMKVSGTLSSSQSLCCEDSHASYLTQLTILHSTQAQATSSVRNEAVCLEVVSVLRRCLGQDAPVKLLLYTRLYECAKDKPALHECILEFLNEQLAKYVPEGEQPLWDQCVNLSATGAVLVEPISHLLYVIAQFLQEEEDLEDILASQAGDSGAVLRGKLALDLTRLCESEDFGKVDLEEPISDLTPESKAKTLKVQQILSSYEALIGYQLMRWDRTSPRSATTLLQLFKGYSQLLETTKATPKVSKKGNKSTLNETRETVKSQKSQKSQKDKEKGPTKLSSMAKDRAPFKTLPCLWDLKLCLRVIELLYSEDVPWCTSEQRNRIRSSRELHHWALRRVCCVLARADKHHAKLVAQVAAVLYQRCICRFREICDFDDTTALGCVELFKDCLSFILNPDNGLKIDALLSAITGIPEEQESTQLAAMLEQVRAALAHAEEEGEEERDQATTKLVAALCQLAAVLLETPVTCCEPYTSVLLKLEDYVRSSKQDCLSLIPSLLTAGCRTQQEAPLLDDLLDKLTSALGRIDEEDTSAGGEDSPNFPAIDCRTGHTVLTHMCGHLGGRAGGAELMLARARDLSAGQQAPGREQNEVYSQVLIQLCQLSAWTRQVASLRCNVGGSGRVLQALVRLYPLLTALAKQLTPGDVATHTRSIERLLKLCGKKLSSCVDNLVMYLEAAQAQEAGGAGGAARRGWGRGRGGRLVPRLVFEAERFGRQLALLSAKCKMNLMQYLPLGTARDFRIRAPVVEEALRDRPHHITEEEEDRTEAPSPPASEDEANGSDAEPATKRRRS